MEMELELEYLKQELVTIRDALKSSTKQCRELIYNLKTVSTNYEFERFLRDQQLSKILRALLILESRLRQEQKTIQQQLYEKDCIIKNQLLEINKLRQYTKNYAKIKKNHSSNNKLYNNNINFVDKINNVNKLLDENGKGLDESLINNVDKLKAEILVSNKDKNVITNECSEDSSFNTTTEHLSFISSEGENCNLSPGIISQISASEDESIVKTFETFYDPLNAHFKSNIDNNSKNINNDGPIYINIINNQENSIESYEKEEEEEMREKLLEDSSGNWYSDPDEDKINDDVFRSSTYRSSHNNHNSVLECVNQILLRDAEEEDKVLSMPRTFKHKGRIVRFQPARLSDIESVGSEMERRNSEDRDGELNNLDNNKGDDYDDNDDDDDDEEEEEEEEDEEEKDDYKSINTETIKCDNYKLAKEIISEDVDNEKDTDSSGAIPLVIIEPDNLKENIVDDAIITEYQSPSPVLKLKKIEEKTCLSKDLTIARNLDYEDIESIPELNSPHSINNNSYIKMKTPPLLPPKPQFLSNTLILKKIPSPSFLIDETKKNLSMCVTNTSEYVNKYLRISTQSSSSSSSSLSSSSSSIKSIAAQKCLNFNDNKINKLKFNNQNQVIIDKKSRKVPHMVRHFEEFKIGQIDNKTNIIRNKSLNNKSLIQVDQLDIGENFEEFNLDECDLSDDPNRPEADGSETLCPLSNNSTNNNFYSNRISNCIYDHFLEATGLSTKSLLNDNPIKYT